MHRLRILAAGMFLLWSDISAPARAQQGPVPAGAELRLDSSASRESGDAAVAVDAQGNFVVVWESQEPTGFRVFGQRYSSAGARLGQAFPLGVAGVDQIFPRLCMDAGGNFVAVWESFRQNANNYDVSLRRFDRNARPLGNELQVNTHTPNAQISPRIACGASGNFVVTWTSTCLTDVCSGSQDGSRASVLSRRYTSSGTALSGELRVNTYTIGNQYSSDVTMDGAGNFLIVWTSLGTSPASDQDGDDAGIFGQRYDSSGRARGGELQVNNVTAFAQIEPSVSGDPAGNFVVAWATLVDDPGNGRGISVRRFDSTGQPRENELRVDPNPGRREVYQPRVASDGSGNFVVAWEDYGVAGSGGEPSPDGSGYGVFGRLFQADGTARGSVFQANTYTRGNQLRPNVSMGPGGTFVVVWSDRERRKAFGQRYTFALPTATPTPIPGTPTPTPIPGPVPALPQPGASALILLVLGLIWRPRRRAA